MKRGDPGWADEVTRARRRITALARVCVQDYVSQWFTDTVVGPALDRVIRHARGFPDGIRRLVIELPQQEGKTLHTCLMAASLLGQAPRLRVQDIGYGDDFIKMASQYVSDIGASDGFADAFPEVSIGTPREHRRQGEDKRERDKVAKASDTAHQIDTLVRGSTGWQRAGGYFRARSIMGQVGGHPGNVMILEDPYKFWDGENGALNPGWNQRLVNFYGSVFRTRQQSQQSCEVLAFTPWTDDDIRMHVIDRWERSDFPFLWIKLPTRQRATPTGDYAHERERLLRSRPAVEGLARFLDIDADALQEAIRGGGKCRPYDPRPPGVALSLERRGQAYADELYAESNARDLAALLDLAPRRDLVDRFPADLWVPWDPVEFPPTTMEDVRLAVDANGDETEAGSFASAGVWGLRARPDAGPGRYSRWVYRMAEFRARCGYTDFCDGLVRLLREWPEIRTVHLEKAGHARSLATDRTFASRPEVRRVKLVFRDKTISKAEAWRAIDTPLAQRCLHIPLRASTCGRVTSSWVHDTPGASADEIRDGDKMGFLTELARAGRIARNDRTDETALLLGELATGDQTDEVLARLRGMPAPRWA